MTNNPHLLILHGWNHNSTFWINAHEQLPNCKLYIPDLPGFGKEPLPSTTLAIPDYATWVEEYIQQNIQSDSSLKLQDTKLALMGHSFGGRISAYIASKNPKWLHTLILYAAPTLYRPSLQVQARLAISKALKKIIADKQAKKLIKFLNPELAQADKNNLGAVYRKTITFDQTEDLKKIITPTYIIYGENDSEVSKKVIMETAKLINNSHLEIIQNQGHNIHLDNPTLFYGLIRKILNL